MPKFILIDPSIQDYQGHYFEYALRVLQAAEKRGFEPVAATNRKVTAENPQVRVRAVYRFGFWPNSRPGGWQTRWKRSLARMCSYFVGVRAQIRYSRLGLWWAARHQWQHYLRAQSARTGLNAWLAVPLLLAYLAYAVWTVGSFVLRLVPFRRTAGRVLRPLTQYLRQAGQEVVRFAAGVGKPFGQALKPHGPLAEWAWQCVKLTQFVRDTRRLIRLEAMGAGDHAMVSTASPVELMALARMFAGDSADMRGTWHVVFRHNLHGPEAEGAYDERRRALRNAFLQFRAQVPPERAYFYTDTEELTSQYNALGILPFRTLPVPVGGEYFTLRRQGPRQRPLTIAYVGDARREKGYHLLPKLVGDLWSRWVARGAARFQFQSNFSAPAGSPEVAVARAQLRSFPADKVNACDESLSPGAYREQLLATDVLLLPYDAGYYARSSGILAEALTAGIPPVVPAGTWMSMQLTRPHYEHHVALRRSSTVLETRRLADSAWRIVDVPRSRPMLNGRLRLSGRRRRVCRVAVPREASELLVTFRQHTSLRGQFVELQFTQCDRGKRTLAACLQIVGGCDSRVSALLRLDRRTRIAQVCVRNAFSGVPIELSDIRFDFLKAESRPPRAAVGVVLHSPDEFSGAVAEVLRHYAHYRASAQSFAVAWSQRHSPERLVDVLLSTSTDGSHPQSAEGGPPRPHFLSPTPSPTTCRRESL